MLPGELPSPGMIPGSASLMSEVAKAIDYARLMARVTPDSTTPDDVRNFLRAAALLVPGKRPAKKD